MFLKTQRRVWAIKAGSLLFQLGMNIRQPALHYTTQAAPSASHNLSSKDLRWQPRSLQCGSKYKWSHCGRLTFKTLSLQDNELENPGALIWMEDNQMGRTFRPPGASPPASASSVPGAAQSPFPPWLCPDGWHHWTGHVNSVNTRKEDRKERRKGSHLSVPRGQSWFHSQTRFRFLICGYQNTAEILQTFSKSKPAYDDFTFTHWGFTGGMIFDSITCPQCCECGGENGNTQKAKGWRTASIAGLYQQSTFVIQSISASLSI